MKKNCKLFAVVLFAALSVISCKNNFTEVENEIENTNEKAYLTFGINESTDRKITPSKLTWNEVNSIDLTKDSSVVKTWTTTAEKSAYDQMKADTSVALDTGKYTFAVTLKDNDGDILQKGKLKDVEIKVGENPLNFTSKPYLEGKGKLTVNCYGSDSTKIKMVNCHIYNIEKLAGDSHDNSFDKDKYQTSYSFSFDEIDCGIYRLYVQMTMDGAYTRRITECVEIQNKRETVFDFSYDEELKFYPVEYRFDDKDGTRVQFSDDSYNKTYTNTKTLPDASTITNAPQDATFLGWYYEGTKITEIPEVTNTIVVIKPAYEITTANANDLVAGVNVYNITPTDDTFDAICQKIQDGKIACGVLDLSNIATENIPEGAFKGSTVSKVILSENVKKIGASAFNECSELSKIAIPQSVESIGASAFSGCRKLEYITIPKNLTSIENEVFNGCSLLDDIEIPEGVTTIGEKAFNGCSSLSKINIPENVESIGASAFYSCQKLENITIPEKVTTIGDFAFSWCNGLKEIEIPASVKIIGKEAFKACRYLTKVTFETDSNLKSIGDSAFASCVKLPTITIPETVTTIGNYFFSGCKSLTNITIPEGITSIGDHAFDNCENLSTVTFSETSQLKTIGEYAFAGCSSLSEIKIPNSVTTIEKDVFFDCSTLENVEFEEDSELETFDKDALNNSPYSLLITIPYSKIDVFKSFLSKNYSSYSFKVNVEEGITSIEDGKFKKNYALKEISLPSTLTSIENNAFESCSKLEKIEIPASVTSIGDNAFNSCTSLSEVSIPGDSQLTNIGKYAFAGCSDLEEITIPSGITEINEGTFSNTGFSSIDLSGTNISRIGDYAFAYCNDLADCDIPEGLEKENIENTAFTGTQIDIESIYAARKI